MHVDQGHAKIEGSVDPTLVIEFIQSLGYNAVEEHDTFVGVPDGEQSEKLISNENVSTESQSCSFRVTGMTCASCVAVIESYLQTVEGVKSVSVGLLNERADVVYDPHRVNVEQLKVFC